MHLTTRSLCFVLVSALCATGCLEPIPDVEDETPIGGKADHALGDSEYLPGPSRIGVTPERASEVLDTVIALYQDDARALGKELLWEPAPGEGFRARARVRRGDENLVIDFNTDYLPSMSEDVLALIACHEVGHFIAGYPFMGGDVRVRSFMKSAEGQADYFAAKDCLPRLWRNQTVYNLLHTLTVDSVARASCDSSWPWPRQRALCYRIADTAQAHGKLANQTGNSGYPLDFHTELEDSPSLRWAHSIIPCRLKTFLAGASCGVGLPTGVIPGDGYTSNSPAARDAARAYACADGAGARPACWYNDAKLADCDTYENYTCEPDGFEVCDPLSGLQQVSCGDGCEVIAHVGGAYLECRQRECDDATPSGVCHGDIAAYCFDGSVEEYDCSDAGGCVEQSGEHGSYAACGDEL